MAMLRLERPDDIGEAAGSNPALVAQLFCRLLIALFNVLYLNLKIKDAVSGCYFVRLRP